MPVLPISAGSDARKRVETFADPPAVTQFLDPGQRVGHDVARRLGWPADRLAYDVYLLYGPDARWPPGGPLPEPAAWFHQHRQADRSHYRTEEALVEALVEAARDL